MWESLDRSPSHHSAGAPSTASPHSLLWTVNHVRAGVCILTFQKCRVKDERSDICEALTIFLSLSNGVIDPNTTLDARGMALNMWMKFLLPWSSYFRAGKQRINTRISK